MQDFFVIYWTKTLYNTSVGSWRLQQESVQYVRPMAYTVSHCITIHNQWQSLLHNGLDLNVIAMIAHKLWALHLLYSTFSDYFLYTNLVHSKRCIIIGYTLQGMETFVSKHVITSDPLARALSCSLYNYTIQQCKS